MRKIDINPERPIEGAMWPTAFDPADRGVRVVALSLITSAQMAGDKLTSLASELRDGGAGADDALHDFRVAVRRLRSWVRAFRPLLADDVSRKQRRHLSRIFDATRATRDATVHLEWLHKERPVLSARQRVGQAWLSERLVSQRSSGAEGALAAAADFESMMPKLTRRLSFYRAPVSELERTPRFGSVLAKSLRTQSEKLRRQLAAVHDFTDVRKAHRARISAKNLRYVIEPVAKLVGEGDAIIQALKTLQDSLGDLHDVHVFAGELVAATQESEDDRVRRARSRDPGPGLLGLARHLHERGIQSYANLERDWLNDAGAEFFERVREFAAALEHRARFGTEIEHKYLLTRLPAAALDAPSVEIEQGYLPGEKLVERIRRVTMPDGAEKWFRTVKAGNGLERVELEEEADVNLAQVMWGLTNGRRLRKRRYSICESDGLTWEVDEFLDRELVLAEIEVPTPDTRFEVPVWLHDVMDREVTDEPEYSNARLAQSPASQ
jgi:CHAD domain-containing protein/CYTH domain-containing protein